MGHDCMHLQKGHGLEWSTQTKVNTYLSTPYTFMLEMVSRAARLVACWDSFDVEVEEA